MDKNKIITLDGLKDYDTLIKEWCPVKPDSNAVDGIINGNLVVDNKINASNLIVGSDLVVGNGSITLGSSSSSIKVNANIDASGKTITATTFNGKATSANLADMVINGSYKKKIFSSGYGSTSSPGYLTTTSKVMKVTDPLEWGHLYTFVFLVQIANGPGVCRFETNPIGIYNESNSTYFVRTTFDISCAMDIAGSGEELRWVNDTITIDQIASDGFRLKRNGSNGYIYLVAIYDRFYY